MATFKKVVTESADDTIAQSTTGSAATLTTARAIAVSGTVSGTANFDGSAGITISTSLATGAVAAGNLQNSSVGTQKIANDAVTQAKIAEGAVGVDEIDPGAVDVDRLASNAVTTAKILDGAVSEAKLDIGNTPSDGYVLSWDNTASNMSWVAGGDITGVTAGTGLSGGGTSGDVTLTVDLSELQDMTGAMASSDEFIVLDAGADRRKAASEIGLSIFNNDSGFTTNTGTVTSVATGTGIAGGTITGSGTISLDLSELTVETTFTAGADAIPFHDDGAGADKLAEQGTIPVSFFNNDANYVVNSRSITAGNGLTGGGDLSANRTINVGAGTGVTVASNSISIGQDVATNANVDFNTVTTTGNVTVGGDLTVSGATITTSTETLEIADNTLILNSDLGSNAGVDAGFVVERGTSGDNAALFYDNSDASWKVGTSSTQALPTDGARIALQSVKATLDTTDESVPVGGFQVAGGVAYVRTA